MNIEAIFFELELLCADLCFAGLKNASPVLLKRLADLQKQLAGLGMREGALRMKSLLEVLAAYRRGEGNCEVAADALCALEFYYRHVLEYARAENQTGIEQEKGSRGETGR